MKISDYANPSIFLSLISYFKKKYNENKIYNYLRNNTEDKGGKQWVAITKIQKELKISRENIGKVMDFSTRIYYRSPKNPYEIGLYTKTKSKYEDDKMTFI